MLTNIDILITTTEMFAQCCDNEMKGTETLCGRCTVIER
jgi:hypothetical protein